MLAERCFHHSVAEHMGPLKALVRCTLALQEGRQDMRKSVKESEGVG